jgi:acyl transferase domain-containing protein/acyl carrier protein
MEARDTLDGIEGIAIIGLSGRFPGADSVDQFWQNVCQGVESITPFTDEELLEAGIAPAMVNAPNYVKTRPAMSNVDMFDAAFFNVPPREAEVTDPQQRVFLECCWQALEDAGYAPETCSGWVGVFGGCASNDYMAINLWSNRDSQGAVGAALVVVGNERDYLATRVSYKLNLKGPSFDVQCACSTSLVATHLACQNLLDYRCDLALAGGVSISLPQKSGYLYVEGELLSPDGHCRPFDAKAQGTVFGDGVAVVVLKRLPEALKDGDHIYAVIRGSAVANDGSAKVGFMAPGVDGQKRALALAYKVAEVHPESVGYIETHGTGTALGDPIEMEALTQTFRARTDKKQFCAIGSVKGNIGHLDAAAGATGLVKTALVLKHKMLPPTINFETPNPKIDFANSPFYVNTELREWETNGQPRLAGVSAFGVGGTDAHVVLEEAPAIEPSSESRRYQLLVLSARTETALDRMTDNLAAHLQANPGLNLADAAYTLHVGRQAFEKRRMVVCQTLDETVAALQQRDATRMLTGTDMKTERSVAFMFSGQGSQYVAMGRNLYEREAMFREQVDACAELLTPHLGLDLRDVLYPKEADAEQAAEQLGQTELTQPALFVVEYALARLWMSWGVKPAAMIGHSVGEYVAACLAGVFSLQDALALVAARGRLMQSMPPGAMLSVPLAEADVLPLLDGSLTVATVNGPEQCVVAGPTDAIAALEQHLADEGIAAQRVRTSHAFHSAMMEPILKPFEERVRQVQLRKPQLPYISNVTGTWITTEEATDPGYWARHLRQAVRFSEGVSTLAKTPEQVLLEVGPGRVLRTLARRHPDRAPEQIVLTSMRHPRDVEDDDAFLLRTLGELWMSGVPVDWPAFYRHERRLRVSLPTYSFDRQRYWIEINKSGVGSDQAISLFKAPDVANWFYIPSWKCTMPPVQETQGEDETERRCLLFSTGDRLSTQLAQRLRARGYEVATVLAGEQFAANGDTYTVRPANPDDYQALLATLAPPSHIMHLWNVPRLDKGEPDFTDRTLERSFYSLLFLAQAVAARGLDSGVKITVVSSNVHQVTGDEAIDPEKATLLGPCKVISQELPGVTCCGVDILLPETGSEEEGWLVGQIVAEMEMGAADSIVAYRRRQRLVQVYEMAPLEGVGEAVDHKLREGGVYLITGGLGGIGLTLAEYLARAVHARLVLTGRGRFPAAEAREQWLATHDPQDRTSVRIRNVEALEAAGAEVLVVQADVVDQAQMEAAVRATRERFGAIHGVIHTAGLPGGGVIPLKTREAADGVLRPKVHGTRILESVLRDEPLDFFVLCSSVASAVGGVGQVDYCAANAFMDAFAHAGNGHDGRLTVSINWDAWTGVGMAVNTASDYTTSRRQQALQTTPIDHPLLMNFYRETDKQTVYQMKLSPDENWVLSEHQVMGIPTVPGTTYFDLLRAAFKEQTRNEKFEIHRMDFFTPLMVGLGDSKEAQLIFEERADGYEFQLRSKAGVTSKGELQWQMHAMGKLGPLTDTTPLQYDLNAIRARCAVADTEVTDSVWDEYVAGLGGGFTYGPRWNTPKHTNVGQGEALVLLELGEEFLPDLEIFRIHPAILDVATSFAAAIFPEPGKVYLPLLYKHVRVYSGFPGRVYSYARLRSGSKAGEETMSFQVTLMDEQGRVVMDIEEFTLMQVRETAASRLRDSVGGGGVDASGPSLASNKQGGSSNAILPGEGVEAFRRILFRNSLPQIAVSPIHLPTVMRRTNELAQRMLDGTVQPETGLAKHARPTLKTEYVAPQNEAETEIAMVWRDILGIEEVGIDDNFFDLGGDSLLMAGVYRKLQETLGNEVSMVDLYTYTTIRSLAEYLGQTQGEQAQTEQISLEQSTQAQEWGRKYRTALGKSRKSTEREE